MSHRTRQLARKADTSVVGAEQKQEVSFKQRYLSASSELVEGITNEAKDSGERDGIPSFGLTVVLWSSGES